MDGSTTPEQLFVRIVSKYQDAIDKDFAAYLIASYRFGNVIHALSTFIATLRGLGYSINSLLQGELGQLVQTVAPDLLKFIPPDETPTPKPLGQPQTTQSSNPATTASQPQAAYSIQTTQLPPQQPSATQVDDESVLQIRR